MASEEPSTAPPGEPPVEFEFSDPEVLRMCLQMLNDEASKDEQRIAIDVLIKLCRNIMTHPGEEKYLKIRKENKAIHDKLLKYDGAREFLLAIGWSEVDDLYMFLQDQDLSIAISILDEQLNMLPPQSTASSPPPQPLSSTVQSPDGQTSVWSDDEIKKREKRLEEDRKKRMDDIKRIKREKEEIKKQHLDEIYESENGENILFRFKKTGKILINEKIKHRMPNPLTPLEQQSRNLKIREDEVKPSFYNRWETDSLRPCVFLFNIETLI